MLSYSNPCFIGACTILLVSVIVDFVGRTRRVAPFPPGPKGYPIIGNLLDIPKSRAWITYAEMSKVYGDMIFLWAFRQPILILNSPKRVKELLDIRSASYSGRLQTTMACELVGFGIILSTMEWGATWRKQRKMFHQHYANPAVIPEYHPTMKRHVHKLLLNLLDAPSDFVNHNVHYFGGTLMDITYGYEAPSLSDPFIDEALKTAIAFKDCVTPGTFLVDNIPLLKYLPAWFPGAGFQSWAAGRRMRNENVRNIPFNIVLNAMKRHEAKPCILTRLIEELPSSDDPSYEDAATNAKAVAGVAYLAGTDTTTSLGNTLILLMAKYPEYQRRVQEELDRVVGHGVLPEFTHRADLVFLKALTTEILRWFVVFPLAIPHMTIEDDHYDGFFIPKGTLVMGNTWSILHDPDIFDDPMEFGPERYMKDGQFNGDLLDPVEYFFGYGRRVCPGSQLSLEQFYLMASSTLAMFEILPPINESGQPIELEATFDDGIFLNPEPFECIIRPRSKAMESVIRAWSD